MDKLKYAPLSLFTLFSAKMLILGANWQDCAIILILATLSAFLEFKNQEKKQKEIEEVLRKQNETILALTKVMDELRSNMSSIKIAQGMRPTNGRI